MKIFNQEIYLLDIFIFFIVYILSVSWGVILTRNKWLIIPFCNAIMISWYFHFYLKMYK